MCCESVIQAIAFAQANDKFTHGLRRIYFGPEEAVLKNTNYPKFTK